MTNFLTTKKSSAHVSNGAQGCFLFFLQKDYVEDFCDSEEKCRELFEKGLGVENKAVIQQYFKLAVQCISQQKKKRPDMVQVMPCTWFPNANPILFLNPTRCRNRLYVHGC